MKDAGFIRAICERPHDDAPRLIYADYLEERGDPRAEFIRLQCQLEVEETKHWLLRTRQLLVTHWADWFGASLDTFGEKRLGLNVSENRIGCQSEYRYVTWMQIRRGFIDSVLCSTTPWLQNGFDLVTMQPVTSVTLTDRCAAYDQPIPAYYWFIRPYRWEPARGAVSSWDVPPEFSGHGPFAGINPPKFSVPWGRRLKYDTHEAADAALSGAAIDWARALMKVGPPLWKEPHELVKPSISPCP